MITIAIPTYNRPNRLAESLLSAINQHTEHSYNIIICDNSDNISDLQKNSDLVKVHKSDIIQYYQNKTNLGMFGNWNRCIALSTYPWITILNDDDLLSPAFIETTVTTIANLRHERPLIFTKLKLMGSPSRQDQLKSFILNSNPLVGRNKSGLQTFCLADFLAYNQLHGSLGVTFRADIASQLGGFDPDYYPCSDYKLFTEYVLRFGALRVNSFLAYYRWESNESLNTSAHQGFVKQGLRVRNLLACQARINYLHIKILFALNSYLQQLWLWSKRQTHPFVFLLYMPLAFTRLVLCFFLRHFLYINLSLTKAQ